MEITKRRCIFDVFIYFWNPVNYCGENSQNRPNKRATSRGAAISLLQLLDLKCKKYVARNVKHQQH